MNIECLYNLFVNIVFDLFSINYSIKRSMVVNVPKSILDKFKNQVIGYYGKELDSCFCIHLELLKNSKSNSEGNIGY
jgi:hypothetical protein